MHDMGDDADSGPSAGSPLNPHKHSEYHDSRAKQRGYWEWNGRRDGGDVYVCWIKVGAEPWTRLGDSDSEKGAYDLWIAGAPLLSNVGVQRDNDGDPNDSIVYGGAGIVRERPPPPPLRDRGSTPGHEERIRYYEIRAAAELPLFDET